MPDPRTDIPSLYCEPWFVGPITVAGLHHQNIRPPFSDEDPHAHALALHGKLHQKGLAAPNGMAFAAALAPYFANNRRQITCALPRNVSPVKILEALGDLPEDVGELYKTGNERVASRRSDLSAIQRTRRSNQDAKAFLDLNPHSKDTKIRFATLSIPSHMPALTDSVLELLPSIVTDHAVAVERTAQMHFIHLAQRDLTPVFITTKLAPAIYDRHPHLAPFSFGARPAVIDPYTWVVLKACSWDLWEEHAVFTGKLLSRTRPGARGLVQLRSQWIAAVSAYRSHRRGEKVSYGTTAEAGVCIPLSDKVRDELRHYFDRFRPSQAGAWVDRIEAIARHPRTVTLSEHNAAVKRARKVSA